MWHLLPLILGLGAPLAGAIILALLCFMRRDKPARCGLFSERQIYFFASLFGFAVGALGGGLLGLTVGVVAFGSGHDIPTVMAAGLILNAVEVSASLVLRYMSR
ncbi:MAG: hypothetical protein AAGA56_30585 [Myxococcota bacterium]